MFIAISYSRLQKVGHDWATELNWTELKYSIQDGTNG